jgi:hypothetical protein
MENQETMTYVVDMLKQINQTTLVLAQNQTLLSDQIKFLDKKIDTRCDELDKKIDARCDELDKKIDGLDKKFDARCDELDKKIDARCDELDKKIDARCDELDKKIDARCDELDAKYEGLSQKLDRYYEENRKEHYKMMHLISGLQKDVTNLRTDIDTVYVLEKDSQKMIEKLI